MVMKILLIGPPASGKGTIGKMLSEQLNIPLVKTGDLLRDIPEETIWYQKVHEYMDKGLLAPNYIVGGLLEEVTTHSRYERGYILDGWVRHIDDLEHFDPQIDKVIFLNISKKISQRRTLARRVCEKEGHVYNLLSKKPQVEGICDIDKSKLIKREDDTEEVLNTRFKAYRENTLEVISYFKKNGLLVEINAEGTPKEVLDRVIAAMK